MTNKVLYTYIIFFICCVSLLVTPVYAVNNGTLICNGTSVDNKTYSEINETLVCNGTLVDNKTYGGIPGNVSQPPESTQINLLLSRYYQLPVATSENATFWYGLSYWNVGDYWYTAEELMKLPYDYVKNNRSPYYGGILNGDDWQHIQAPVSYAALAAFGCIAIVLNKKR